MHSQTTNGVHKPKVLVPEKVSVDGLALLRKTLEVDERKGLTPEELTSIIAEYEALIVRSETKVTKALLEAGKKLKVVARAGVGVDNVGTELGPCSCALGSFLTQQQQMSLPQRTWVSSSLILHQETLELLLNTRYWYS